MKLAKATERDIDAAGKCLALLNTISSGYYPGVEDDAPLHFDPKDHAHLSLFYQLMTESLDAAPGWQNRVIGGMCYGILFDKNRIVDPDADTLELHPRFAAVAQALASARKLLERCGPHLQGIEQDCCGDYEPGYGGEYMGQRECVPVCCGRPIDLSDHVANELRVIDAALAGSAS